MEPTEEHVGKRGVWSLPTGDGNDEITAAFLGMSSSRRDKHVHEDLPRCSACRWFEPRIFRESGGRHRFLIHRMGRSVVPGETDRVRWEWMLTAREVIVSLLTRIPGREPFLSAPAARVLAQASEFDDDLYDAYQDTIQKVH